MMNFFRPLIQTKKDGTCSLCEMTNRAVVFRFKSYFWSSSYVCRPCFLAVLDKTAKPRNMDHSMIAADQQRAADLQRKKLRKV